MQYLSGVQIRRAAFVDKETQPELRYNKSEIANQNLRFSLCLALLNSNLLRFLILLYTLVHTTELRCFEALTF